MENLEQINKQASTILNKLDSMEINAELLNNLNKLVNDKLDDIRALTLTDTSQEAFILKVYNAQRYSECYISLNYIMAQQMKEINANINDILKSTKNIQNLVQQEQLKGGVINE